MEKHIPTTQMLSISEDDLKAQSTPHDRITFALDNDEYKGRNSSRNMGILENRRRSQSRDSMSIHSARRRIDPSVALPPQFRTVSFGIEEEKKRKKKHAASFATDVDMKKDKATAAEIEFSKVDYHITSVCTFS